MKVLNCVVTDDERAAREGIAAYVRQLPYLNLLGQCKSAIELDTLLMQESVQLVFLDINMPGLTGVDWLKHAQSPPMTIFTTAHREYALEGFELNVVDYLLKPISFARFSKAANKAFQLAMPSSPSPSNELNEERHIFIKEDNQTIKIYLKDILYFEAAVDYIFIHTTEKKYMTLFSMKQVEREVNNEFLRIHRSFIINTKHVKLIEGRQVIIGESKLPISRNLFADVYDRLVSDNLWRE